MGCWSSSFWDCYFLTSSDFSIIFSILSSVYLLNLRMFGNIRPKGPSVTDSHDQSVASSTPSLKNVLGNSSSYNQEDSSFRVSTFILGFSFSILILLFFDFFVYFWGFSFP